MSCPFKIGIQWNSTAIYIYNTLINKVVNGMYNQQYHDLVWLKMMPTQKLSWIHVSLSWTGTFCALNWKRDRHHSPNACLALPSSTVLQEKVGPAEAPREWGHAVATRRGVTDVKTACMSPCLSHWCRKCPSTNWEDARDRTPLGPAAR